MSASHYIFFIHFNLTKLFSRILYIEFINFFHPFFFILSFSLLSFSHSLLFIPGNHLYILNLFFFEYLFPPFQGLFPTIIDSSFFFLLLFPKWKEIYLCNLAFNFFLLNFNSTPLTINSRLNFNFISFYASFFFLSLHYLRWSLLFFLKNEI